MGLEVPSSASTHSAASLCRGPLRAGHSLQRIRLPWTYGLRVRTIRPDSAISGLTAGVTKTPVRNPSFLPSPTANDDPHDAAICGFHRGCGLIIRRLKKKGPKKGPGKGPTRQIDNACCRFAARNLLQHNDFRVGRRGLEPRTYGLKAFPITPQEAEYQAIAMDFGALRPSQYHPGPSRKGHRPGHERAM